MFYLLINSAVMLDLSVLLLAYFGQRGMFELWLNRINIKIYCLPSTYHKCPVKGLSAVQSCYGSLLQYYVVGRISPTETIPRIMHS